MVKFSKQFEGQLVPEWKEAFVDYYKLKKCLKKTHFTTHQNQNQNQNQNKNQNSLLSSLKRLSLFGHSQRNHHEPIQVHTKLASSASKIDVYETELFERFADTEADKDFFSCLDLQLNKVNQFYKEKEKEFLERSESLQEQMRILIQLKTVLAQKKLSKGASSMDDFSSDDLSISCTFSNEECSRERMEEDDMERNVAPMMDSPRSEDVKLRTLSGEIFNCQGKNMKISIPLTTPTRTFTAMSNLLRGDSANLSKKFSPDGSKMQINKTMLYRAEKVIKEAFVDLYKGLGYLKTYRHLNMLAFVKILKKFDKATGKQVLPIYLKVVESSYFNSSYKVVNLASEVEELFTKHFAHNDKRKTLKCLKSHQFQRKESHVVTYFIGLFSGCFIALLVGYVIMAHITRMYNKKSNLLYMKTVYPLLSMFSLLFLHFFLHGCNIFMWRKSRINYIFIFELSPTKELKYRDVFLICTAAMTVVVGVMFAHLTLIAKGYPSYKIQTIPGLLLLIFLLILICPLKIFYHSSRYRFLRALRNTALSPLYKVVMLDFYLAEQLCSQVPMLRNFEHVACYYMTGSYKSEDYGYCKRVTKYRDLAYVVSFLPYYWRAMQCGRRWFDEGELVHLGHLGKYVSAMLAAGARVAYENEKNKSVGWLCLLVVMTCFTTIYHLYWDYVRDWGLLQPNSKNLWLRNDLILRRKFVYYLSMGLNLVLRLAWLQTVLYSSFENVEYGVPGLCFAALEVVRRGLSNFHRVENEHLNNVGKFRAVKTVPLPFSEVDDED